MTTVYFGTNRKADAAYGGGYGADIVGNTEAELTFAVAEVTNISLPDEASGVIASISAPRFCSRQLLSL